MRDLSSVRDGWDEREAFETELLRRLTIPQGIAQLEALYREFRSRLEETEPIFREQRVEAMAQLQERLRRSGF